MKRSRLTSQLVTRVAFVVIVVFLLAQVAGDHLSAALYRRRHPRHNLRVAARRRHRQPALHHAAGTVIFEQLTLTYPHLRWEDGAFEIDPADLREFRAVQTGHLRMFAFEGPFYALVILAGLYVIGLSLRAERELKRRQQNFLNAVSHEFKTPISTLRLLIETALYRPLKPEKQRDYLGRMEREVTRLEAMSEQVLASARLEHAPMVQTLGPAELNGVVREAVERERSGLEARGARLDVVYTPDTLPVSLDPAAFGVVLGNLLDNAVKYSPDAEKAVRVRLESRRHLAVVHVEDEGIGLAEGEKARVFDPFYRVGDELTRAAPGVGLGLHLVRSMTEAMNGWVRCDAPLDPQTGRGSRFSVVLPKRLEFSPLLSSRTLEVPTVD
jgi:signal transduction histidine kinase